MQKHILISQKQSDLNYMLQKRGYMILGLGSEFIGILESRLNNKTSPGLYVSRLWESKYNGNVNQTVSEIIQHVWNKTKDNSPLL